MLEDGLLGRLAAQQLGKQGKRPQVGEPGRDMRPLAWIGALGEEAAERVERLGSFDDPVCVVVDEGDLVQYFEKWPWCSNSSSPAS
jgi:hypothetical protein